MLKTDSMHVLLAGEMLKTAKAVFNISPVGAIFFLKMLLAGEMLKVFFFFENVLLAGEILKKLKNVKSGGNYVCESSVHKHSSSHF